MGSVLNTVKDIALMPAKIFSGGGEENNPGTPALPDEMMAARDRQIKDAQEFRTNLPKEQERQGSMAADASRQALSSRMENIKSQANSRGLLYSGLKTGAEAGAQTAAAGALAKRQAQIGQGLQGQANQMDQGAIQAGMNYANTQNMAADTAFKNAMRNRQMQQQGQSSFMGGIGKLGGSMAGRGAGG